MRATDILIYLSLILFVLYITRINNMWGVSKGANKVKRDIKTEKSKQIKRKRAQKWLSLYMWASYNLGVPIRPNKELEYRYKIERLGIKVKSLERYLNPVELDGFFKTIIFTSLLAGSIMFALTYSIFSAVFLLGVFAPAWFHMYASMQISEEDAKLERDFPDLYMLLYSRLLQGSNSRLAPTLSDFIRSLDAMRSGEDRSVIRKFVTDLQNNIDIYGDDTIAVRKLRDKYRSVMVINFSNLATQALSGVSNGDKLLSFKMELNQRKNDMMDKKAEKLVKRGTIAAYSIFIILGQFIVISWVAKLYQSGQLDMFLSFR